MAARFKRSLTYLLAISARSSQQSLAMISTLLEKGNKKLSLVMIALPPPNNNPKVHVTFQRIFYITSLSQIYQNQKQIYLKVDTRIFYRIIMMQYKDEQQQLLNLTSKMLACSYDLLRRKSSEVPNSCSSNQQIDSLELHDYLKLHSHQKKKLSPQRWHKLAAINQSASVQQQDYCYFLVVVSEANYFKLLHPGYYEQLVALYPQYPEGLFTPILNDIQRTFSGANSFQTPLKNILCSYAIRNPALLYCQGMNYVIAYLLMNGLPQEDAFWMLVSLVEKILPPDYYRNLETVAITTKIFTQCFRQIFPEFEAQMKQVGMDPSFFLVGWYVCLFTKGFTNAVSVFLLSKIMLEAQKSRIGFTLLRISLALIFCVLTRERQFSYHKNYKSFKDSFETAIFEASISQIKESLEYINLHYSTFLEIENKYRQIKQERQSETFEFDLKSSKIVLPQCNIQYPVCLQRVQIQKKYSFFQQVQILKNGIPIEQQYNSNYFMGEKLRNKQTVFYMKNQDCQIARRPHICQLKDTTTMAKKRLELKKDSQIPRAPIQEGQSSFEFHSQLSGIEEKFTLLSTFFVVDGNYSYNQQGNNIYPLNQDHLEPGSLYSDKTSGPYKKTGFKDQTEGALIKNNPLKVYVEVALSKVWDSLKHFQKKNSLK